MRRANGEEKRTQGRQGSYSVFSVRHTLHGSHVAGLVEENGCSCFGFGGRPGPHALRHERRKHLHKRFSSTHSPQADGCPEGPVSCSLAVIGCLSICCA